MGWIVLQQAISCATSLPLYLVARAVDDPVLRVCMIASCVLGATHHGLRSVPGARGTVIEVASLLDHIAVSLIPAAYCAVFAKPGVGLAFAVLCAMAYILTGVSAMPWRDCFAYTAFVALMVTARPTASWAAGTLCFLAAGFAMEGSYARPSAYLHGAAHLLAQAGLFLTTRSPP